jgi:hypothetical protein
MFCGVWIVSGIVAAAQAPAASPAQTAQPANPTAGAADRITLRDGSVALGLITSVTGGPRGAVEFLVRRDWARANLPNWAARWERVVDGSSRQAARQRLERLAAWRRQRAVGRPEGDRILAWIDRERKRLEQPGQSPPSVLIPAHLSRGDVRDMARQPQANSRLLQLGWLCGLPKVESLPPDSLKDALEGRGFAADGQNTPPVEGLLPLSPEPEMAWLARRAATELALDPDLRFVRYQGMVFPAAPGGQGQAPGLNGLDLTSALGELGRLLDPDTPREDPLVATFKKIGESGRVGAVITRLELPADLSHAHVESTLWVRAGAEQWVPFLRRSSAIRPEEISLDAGGDLAGDPQVKAAFSLVEGLGLGKVPPELKERSLKMGAATQRALETVRAAIGQDLNRLMLPVFEPGDDRQPVKERPPDKRPGQHNGGPAPSREPAATAPKPGP